MTGIALKMTVLKKAVRSAGLSVLAVLGGLTVAAGAGERPAPLVWTQDTFADFAGGTFEDAGQNVYVSAAGRMQLINKWDLNNDGNLDLVFCNTHPHVEKLDASIYWGNGKDFDDRRKSYVPNEGAQRTVAADLDGDGKLDAVMPHYTNGTWSNMPSAVYYQGGSAGKAWENAPFKRKVSLPTQAAQGAAVADLNRDGFPDLVFALSAGFWEYRGASALASPSRIYWGAKEGYSSERFLDLEAQGASDVECGDLNGDGWPDIVFANREKAGKFAVDSYIYWGGPSGFVAERRTSLPTNQANAVSIADVNQDKLPDLIFANGEGKESPIYLNAEGGFSLGRRVMLPTSDARDCAVADTNGDGLADVFFSNHQTSGNPLTLSSLFLGTPDGFDPERRLDLETVGAWGASLADLNEDGRPDLVVSCNREYTSYDVPSYIYWNGPIGFLATRRTALFTHGAVGNTVADFNGDGHLDLVFNNTIGRSRGGVTPSYLYWGDPKGRFSEKNRWEFSAVEPYDWAGADLDDDGRPELIIANQAEIGRRITESYLFWGSKAGFSEERRTALVGHGAKGISVADLDRDGWLDLVVYNALAQSGIYVYWGGTAGYVTSERTVIPFGSGGTPTVADLNGDGHLDLIATNNGKDQPALIYWGDGSRTFTASRRSEVPDSQNAANAEVADLNRDGRPDLILTRRQTATMLLYFAEPGGRFSGSRRQELKTSDCQGVTVGDLDRGGFLDIVAPFYSDTGSRATRSKVYLGGRDGYSDDRSIVLPTNAGTGSQIADYNRDGYPDLLFICHRSEGDPDKVGAVSDHVTPSFLYWGGKDGFREDRKLLLPSRGAHYDSGVDLGNIVDRSFRWRYLSAPFECGSRRSIEVHWKAETPLGTSVEFQLRSAGSKPGLTSATWSTTLKRAGKRITLPAEHAWAQYRAVLASPDGSSSPVLDSVRLVAR